MSAHIVINGRLEPVGEYWMAWCETGCGAVAKSRKYVMALAEIELRAAGWDDTDGSWACPDCKSTDTQLEEEK